MSDLNHPVAQGFVSPKNCLLLMEAGLNLKTPYAWKLRSIETVLHTEVFDLDNHYRQVWANIDHTFPCKAIPAFQLNDMEKILPDYYISRTANLYTLSCDEMFKLDQEQDNRLPDVFAKMVLQGFKKRILIADNCIQILTAQ